MADALISIVLEQLSLYVQSEVTLVLDTRQNVHQLTVNLKLIQAVLADAEQKQVQNKAVRLWLNDLKQIVYDADDVLDEWRTREAISQIQQSDIPVAAGNQKKVFLSCLLSPCFCFKDVIVRYDIGHQIKDINMRLDAIARQRTDFGLKVVEVDQNHDEPRRLTSSVVDLTKVHGRDYVKEDIMSRLSGESSSQGSTFRVISIVGIGGLGKTTLARLIFNEERVVDIFKTKMWACVSEPFNLVRVAKAIIKEAAGDVPNSAEWQEVHKCLCETVKGKQFLLVLDDVWTEDPNYWNQLKLALDGGAPGSRIIVTTRNRTVAKIMGSVESDIHELEKLSDDDSWSVLRDVALVGRDKELEKFEKIGREIAIKCKGVPLAVTILASLLCGRQTKKEWKDVLGSDLWEMPQIEQFFLPSLFLSYNSLPFISKQCFLYCAVFPKDSRMRKLDLIRLWMAQGFFEFEERKELEKFGEDHFRILAMRSFFQDFEKDSDGNIISCKMHDLVHDFALYLSQNESCSFCHGDTLSSCDKIRHLCAVETEIPHILKAKKMRTLLLIHETNAVPIELFDKLSYLRTLVLECSNLEVLPNEVEKLVHLRYLDLSETELRELPETVCNLYNLQVLGLDSCENLHKLPERIEKLSNLRHLSIEETDALDYIPKTIASMSSLRTLSKFIVSVVDNGCMIGDLRLLNNLQGALVLKGLSRVTNGEEAIQANLKMKKHLREITFCFNEDNGVRTGMKNVLEKLEPHEDLEILKIRGYSDSQFPSWVGCRLSLASVVEISLIRCRECIELPAFGKLGSLKKLEIEGMGSVTSIGKEFYGDGAEKTAFPKLECLVIEDMEKLEEWKVPTSKHTKIMPILRDIELRKCPMLRVLPSLGRLESLEKLGFEKLSSVGYIGKEFYGFDDGDSSLCIAMSAFPKLECLVIEDMVKLEEWEVPISKHRKIMPLLRDIELRECPMLRALPSLGRLESLEKLRFKKLSSVGYIGKEFYGFDDGDSSLGVEMIAFPKLRKLAIDNFNKLEEWEIPTSKEDRKIMPLVSKLELTWCPKLRALPRVWRMEALEELVLGDLESVKGVGVEFADGDNEDVGGVTFHKLTKLVIENIYLLEEWRVPLITPYLKKLKLCWFLKLKRLPTFHGCLETLESLEIEGMRSWEGQEKIVINDSEREGDSCGALRSLEIRDCSKKLSVVPDYLFSPSLVELKLEGDVGVLYDDDSFSDYANKLCSLTKLLLGNLPRSCLPKGFSQLKTLEWLRFSFCQTLDFDLKELAHFTQLRNLEINYCPLLKQRFEGDGWKTILAHVHTIKINNVEITTMRVD